jgi:Sulfotransferase family
MIKSGKKVKNVSLNPCCSITMILWMGMFLFGVIVTRTIRINNWMNESRALLVEEIAGNLRSGTSVEWKNPLVEQSYRSIPFRKAGVVRDIVKSYDYIYEQQVGNWDSSPIVIESHKLIFFTVAQAGCTVWKQLFRRMARLPDWKSQDSEKLLPHDPKRNGLKYLYDYTPEEASTMMTSPDWKRAMMVREPKLRFLSTFIDKVIANDQKHIQNKCCPDRYCVEDAQTIPGFLDLCYGCQDEHWMSQHDRIDEKYWPYMDYVLQFENATVDSKRLLSDIGAWDDYGKSGWGKDDKLSMFQTNEKYGTGDRSVFEQWQIFLWYTPETEKQVEEFYRDDYSNPLFNFTRGTCLTCLANEEEKVRNRK